MTIALLHPKTGFLKNSKKKSCLRKEISPSDSFASHFYESHSVGNFFFRKFIDFAVVHHTSVNRFLGWVQMNFVNIIVMLRKIYFGCDFRLYFFGWKV